MKRKIIKIDKNKCNGCGACAEACHEGAIAIEGDKAILVREDYCDGLGDCLPACPTGAITFEQREAPSYCGAASPDKEKTKPCQCPSTRATHLRHDGAQSSVSRLMQWPCQIKLVPVGAPYFNGASLLIAADCTAYAYGAFHNDFMKNRITLIGCPKLDDGDYAQKLAAIISENDIESVTVVRMEVPCCSGIENAVKSALKSSIKRIPWQVITISTDGKIID